MSSNSAMALQRTRNLVYGLLLLAITSKINALAITYCSPDLTAGSFQAVFNTYQTNGACQNTCQGSYAFAVLKGQNCWCSDYAPSSQVSTFDCSTTCAGFPSEWCGNEAKGYYGYYQLDGKAPKGTSGGSNPTSGSSTSIRIPSSTVRQPSTALSTITRGTATPTEVYTSITTVTGQVRTVVITPTPSSDSTLGSGTSVNSSGGGVGTGTVVGIVVGVALGIGLVIGLGVWFWLRRKHQRRMEAVVQDDTSNRSNNGIPSRQVSQMSSAGLLGKAPRINTLGLGPSNNPRSAETMSSNVDRRSLGTDQRLNPYAIYAHDEMRHSNVSLQDNQDYSRQLRVANPDS